MPENGRQHCLPAGPASVLFCDCAKSKETRRVMALSECSVKVVLPGSVANERNGRGIWQRNLPSHINNYALGRGPFNVPQRACPTPSSCCFKSILLSCSDCRMNGLQTKFMAGTGARSYSP